MKIGQNILIVFALFIGTSLPMHAQETENNAPINFYLGGSYTIAPTFNINGRWTVNVNTSANFYSLFADLLINDILIGRVQTSFLSVSSLGDNLSSELVSGFEMNGSLGYSYRPSSNPKISIPIMATIGFATVVDDDSRDAGMQVGGTVGLNYQLTPRVSASNSFRYLKGLNFSDGSKFDQIDFSIGVQFKLL